jgi:hypothetical protein
MGGVEFMEVWGPPTSAIGRLLQFGFLSTLLGAVPLAIVGYRWASTMVTQRLTLAMAILLLAGCFRGGTWADDPRNFSRAWGVEPPANVQVIRSWYWRSAHFTREEIYYFHLRAPLSFAEAFASTNNLRPTEPHEINAYSFPHSKPDWFAPGDPEIYRIWSTGSDFPSAYVLVDRRTGDIFIHAAQL